MLAIGGQATLAQVVQEARERTAVLDNEGRDHTDPVRGLTGNLLAVTSGPQGLNSGIFQNLDIEASNWTATVGIGAAARCAYDRGGDGRTFNWGTNQWDGEAKPMVGYHIANDKYTNGEPIARACTYHEGGALKKVKDGWFTVRVYGKISLPGFSEVHSLKTPAPPQDPNTWNWNGWGYHATFKPGKNCGPARWPTPELRTAGLPPYAEWCEFVVDAGGGS